MKKKFSRILGVGLTFVLLVSLMAFAAPVSAGTLSWTAFSPVPTSTSEVLEECDVVDIAVFDADIIYAGGGANFTYKTTDGGRTWSAIDFDTASSGNDTDLVAVAPDDSDIVAVADTTTKEIWMSIDGGTTWGSLGVPTGIDTINDIAISASSSGIHYLGVAGVDGDAAEVATYMGCYGSSLAGRQCSNRF